MGTTQSAALSAAVDVEAWRQRIRQDTSARYHCAMGIAIEREGNPAEAMEAYRRTLSICPDMAVASYRLLMLLTRLNRLEEAEAVRRSARSFDDDFEFTALCAIAVDLIGHDEPRNARSFLEQALRIHPDDPLVPCLLDLCRWFEGEPVVRPADGFPSNVEAGRAEPIGELYSAIGLRKFGDQDWEQARLCFEAALTFAPGNHVAGEYLARLEHRSGNPDKAIRLLETIIPDSGGKVECLELLGDILMQVGRPADAEPLFRRLVDRLPRSAHAWIRLGNANMALERFNVAVESFRSAVEADSLLPEGHVNLALALLPLGRSAEAESHLRLALSQKPSEGSNHVHLGAALLISGRYADAEKAFLAGQGLLGDSSWPLAWIALVRLHGGDVQNAVRMARQAVDQEPASSWALSILALAHHAQGQLAAAVASHEEAFALSGSAPWFIAWIQGNAAVTWLTAGDRRAAAAAAQAAAHAAPAWTAYQQAIRPEWARTTLALLLSNAGL